ncbi:hypothetical protein D3C85_1639690 [compost metagenome]
MLALVPGATFTPGPTSRTTYWVPPVPWVVASEKVLLSLAPGIHAEKKWCCSMPTQPPVTSFCSGPSSTKSSYLRFSYLSVLEYHAAPWKLYCSALIGPFFTSARGTRLSWR